jgi:hypothetical protein
MFVNVNPLAGSIMAGVIGESLRGDNQGGTLTGMLCSARGRSPLWMIRTTPNGISRSIK